MGSTIIAGGLKYELLEGVNLGARSEGWIALRKGEQVLVKVYTGPRADDAARREAAVYELLRGAASAASDCGERRPAVPRAAKGLYGFDLGRGVEFGACEKAKVTLQVFKLGGHDLARIVQLQGTLGESDILCIIRDILADVRAITAAGIQQHDMKTDNLVMTTLNDVLHVIDFDVAVKIGTENKGQGNDRSRSRYSHGGANVTALEDFEGSWYTIAELAVGKCLFMKELRIADPSARSAAVFAWKEAALRDNGVALLAGLPISDKVKAVLQFMAEQLPAPSGAIAAQLFDPSNGVLVCERVARFLEENYAVSTLTYSWVDNDGRLCVRTVCTVMRAMRSCLAPRAAQTLTGLTQLRGTKLQERQRQQAMALGASAVCGSSRRRAVENLLGR